MAETLIGLGTDVLALLVLVGVLYRRRPAAPEMVLLFASLNLGLFAAMVAISSGGLKVGAGFGLFGLLSLVRLRSATFSIREMAYTFLALVLALVNGIGLNDWVSPALSLVLLATAWLVDDATAQPPSRLLHMTLDQALVDPDAVRDEVARRLGAMPLAVAVDRVDFVRETTVVAVRTPAESQWWQWVEPEAETEADA